MHVKNVLMISMHKSGKGSLFALIQQKNDRSCKKETTGWELVHTPPPPRIVLVKCLAVIIDPTSSFL